MKPYQMMLTGLLLFSAALLPAIVSAQQAGKKNASGKEAEIRDLVTSGKYVFKAQRVLPMSGHGRFLTSDYDLAVSPDTVKAYLPYFGRAYSAPMDPSKGGIQFTSTRFEYKIEDHKKGGWDVLIKPQDTRDVQQLSLNISKSGSASLQVISNRRQPISFTGDVVKKD